MVVQSSYILLISLCCNSIYVHAAVHGLLIPETELFIKPAQKPTITLTTVIKKTFDPYASVRDYFFWWRTLPTIGLEDHPDFSPVFYPFLPHQFSLQELAPTQGVSITIGLLDNGTAHATLYTSDNKIYLKAHPYLKDAIANAYTYVGSLCGDSSWADIQELILYYTDQTHHTQVTQDFRVYKPELLIEQHLTYYLIAYGKQDLKKNNQLTYAGTQAVARIQGCLQKSIFVRLQEQNYYTPLHFFSVPEYVCTYKPVRYADQHWLHANHGSYCAGLITGRADTKFFGIAPYAKIVSYKVMTSSATRYQDPLPLVHALEDAAARALPIISISYSMQSLSGYQQRLEKVFKQIPYACIAVGNKQNLDTPNALTDLQGNIVFVGSFGIQYNAHTKTYTYPISSFNSRLINQNSLYIVLPGESLLSCCYTPCAAESRNFFVFMQGTSAATPLMAGFLSLLLATCYPTLSYAQIKQLLVRALVRLHADKTWRGLETIDMRMALFMGHVMMACKKLDKNFQDRYEQYLDATRSYLLHIINTYGRNVALGIDFEKGMIDFLHKARQLDTPPVYTHHNLAQSVQETAKKVRAVCV